MGIATHVIELQAAVRKIRGLIEHADALVVIAQRHQCSTHRRLVDGRPLVAAELQIRGHRRFDVTQLLVQIGQPQQRNALDVADIASLLEAAQGVRVLLQLLVRFAQRHQHATVVRPQLLRHLVVVDAEAGHLQHLVRLAEAVPGPVVSSTVLCVVDALDRNIIRLAHIT